ncbi:MAG: hypothetical protein KUG75_03580 [Pseudomonadales bacterium]|nr:hypothetical protein [Pseudomonadales bacterium]
MKYLIASLFLLLCINNVASEESISISIKPSTGLRGTLSFNIHPDNKVTLLIYESAIKISEAPVSIDAETFVHISQLSKQVFEEIIILKDFSHYPEYQQTASIAITHDHVTKSISTRRYSEQLISLIKEIKNYVPNEYKPKLEKK